MAAAAFPQPAGEPGNPVAARLPISLDRLDPEFLCTHIVEELDHVPKNLRCRGNLRRRGSVKVGPRRGVSLSAGPFPRAASRTRRALSMHRALHKPRRNLQTILIGNRPRRGNHLAAVAVTGGFHLLRVEQLPHGACRPPTAAAIEAT